MPSEHPAGGGANVWQRLRGWFRLWRMTGSPPPAMPPEVSAPTWEPLQLGSSSSDDFSFFDEPEEDMAKIAANNPGTLVLFSSLNAMFEERPFDVPFYTARKGRAFIVLIFSEKALPRAATIDRVASGDHPMALDLTPILDGDSPILRASLMFPDHIRAPLMFETLLNLGDEDVQEFLQAALDSDELDLLLRHEAEPELTIELSVSAPRLGRLVHSQVTALGSGWPRDETTADSAKRKQRTARVHRTTQSGSGSDVKLRRVGRAKCLLR